MDTNYNNIEAERGVMLCLVHGDSSVARIVFSMVQERDFSQSAWRDVYSICRKLHSNARTINEANVCIEAQELPNGKYLCTWLKSALGGEEVHEFDCERYAGIVAEASKRRDVHELLASKQAMLKEKPSEQVICELQSDLSRIEDQGSDVHAVSEIGQLVREVAADATEGAVRDLWGLHCGFAGGALDNLTGGIQSEQLWILTGTTGVGKSMCGLSILYGFRRDNAGAGRPLVISTEMYPNAIIRRLLAIAAGVPVVGLLRRNLCASDRQAVSDVAKSGILDDIAIAYFPGRSVDYIHEYAKRHKKQYVLPIMLIDLMEGLKHGEEERDEYTQLTKVCRRVNEIKGSLGTCILGVVQQNAAGYGGGNEKGAQDILACIKGTGQFRQDADKVLGFVRKGDTGYTEVWQAKDRDPGTIGKITVEWLAGKSAYRLVEDAKEDKYAGETIPSFDRN